MADKIRRYSVYFGVRHFNWAKERSVIRNLCLALLHIPLLVFPKDYWHNKAEQTMRSYNQMKTSRRGSFSIWWHGPWLCSSEVFDDYIDVDFEGDKYKVIKAYDEYLRCQYGDYMQLPPEEKRIAKHDYTAYWKD